MKGRGVLDLAREGKTASPTMPTSGRDMLPQTLASRKFEVINGHDSGDRPK